MKKYLTLLLVLLGLLLASCGPTPAPAIPTPDTQLATIVAATMQAMTPASPNGQSPSGGFQFNNVGLAIPKGLATGATGETVARVEGVADAPTWDVAPEYTRVTLQGYVTGERFHKPQIFVYPAEEFAQMNDAAARAMDSLRSILPGTAPLADELPHLPPFNAAQMFSAHAQLIDFGSGRGVRYITMYSQAYIPINNNELFYTFQGLTSDGKYYLSVQLPITAAILDTMVAPDMNSPNFTPDQWETYLDGVTTTLNSMSSVFFSPTIDTLDEFVHTITLSP